MTNKKSKQTRIKLAIQQLDRAGWTTPNIAAYAMTFNVKAADLVNAKAGYDDPDPTEVDQGLIPIPDGYNEQ